MSTKKLATLGILGALTIVVNLITVSFNISLVPAVPFLSYDAKDVIITITGFIYGPMASFILSLVTSTVELMYNTGHNPIIDLLMNVISTCSMSCTAAFIYKKMKSKQGAVIGLITGVVLSTTAMVIWNIIVTPGYYGMPRQAIVELVMPGFLPFNLIKSGLNASLVLLVYKPIITAFRSTLLVEGKGQKVKYSTGLIILGLFLVVTIILIILVLNDVI